MVKINIPKPELKGFVIYNPANGLFSRGGSAPRWDKKPKIWNNIGHLKNHLHAALDRGSYRNGNNDKEYTVSNIYRDCVVYDIVSDTEVDLDMYKYIEEHIMNGYYGRNGYTIVYR